MACVGERVIFRDRYTRGVWWARVVDIVDGALHLRIERPIIYRGEVPLWGADGGGYSYWLADHSVILVHPLTDATKRLVRQKEHTSARLGKGH